METVNVKLLKSSSRIVVKVGSSLLVNSKNKLINKRVLNNICRDLNFYILQNKEVLVVSSGAFALGKKLLNIKDANMKISEKQAIASVGQIFMINGWNLNFT